MKNSDQSSDTETGYSLDQGLAVYESAMGEPYSVYARSALTELLRSHRSVPGRCLDLACGAGHLVDYLASKGWQAYGCDLSTDMIQTARNRYPHLADRFFCADMAEIRTELTFDLVTVVFNSIHYLGAPQRKRFWDNVSKVIKDGGLLVSQQNTHQAMRAFWLNRCHRWRSDDGYAFWSARNGSVPDSVNVEKQYFQNQGDGTYRLYTAEHRYHFFPFDEMERSLGERGMRIIDTRDGRTLQSRISDTNSIWVVARRDG
jgi:Trans-aconitate methyltransferase